MVAALALLTLAAALLGLASTAASDASRAVRAERASLAVESAARHALVHALAAWTEDRDSLPIGVAAERALRESECGGVEGTPLEGRLRVQRLDNDLWALTVDVRATAGPTLARRRVQLLVQRRPPGPATDSLPVPAAAPAPIAQWSIADLY